MNKYECSKCKRPVVVHSAADSVSLKCCTGDTPVSFKKIGTAIIVPVKKLPEAMTSAKPLPPSTPAPE